MVRGPGVVGSKKFDDLRSSLLRAFVREIRLRGRVDFEKFRDRECVRSKEDSEYR